MTGYRQVVVCCGDTAHLLRSAVLSEPLKRRIVGVAEFKALLQRGEVGAAVVAPGCATPELLARLREMRERGCALPVIELSPVDVAATFRTDWADTSVRANHAHITLVHAVRRVAISRVLHVAHGLVQDRVRPKSPVDLALCAVLTHEPPFTSSEELCTYGACVSATLTRHWAVMCDSAVSVPTVRALTASTYVAWVLLLRALELKRHNLGWDRVAAILRTTGKRLQRLAKSLTGHALDLLETGEPLLAVATFERDALLRIGIKLNWDGFTAGD